MIKMTSRVVFGFLLLFCAAAAARADEIRVGGDLGWTLQEYPPLNAKVGDVLLFEFPPEHTVVELDRPDCDFTNSTPLADRDSSPFALELTEPGTLVLASNVEGQCEAGMMLKVDVFPKDVSGSDEGNEEGEDEEEDKNEGEGGKGSGSDSSGEIAQSEYKDVEIMDHNDDDGWWWGGWGEWDDK